MHSGRSLRDELTSRVADALVGHDLYHPETGGAHGNALLLVDPVLATSSGVRRQPILISKQLDPIFQPGRAYCLPLELPDATGDAGQAGAESR